MALDTAHEIQWLANEILPKILKSGRLLGAFDESQLESFKVADIEIAIIGVEEAFMMTRCYRATVNFEYAGVQHQRKLVVKRTPELPPQMYAEIMFDELFSNEIKFYTEILPIIDQLSQSKFTTPKYYYSELQPNAAVIILGDFGVDNWWLPKQRFGLSLEHATLAVQYLGRFHGLGYAMKHTQANKFKALTCQFKESRFKNENPRFALLQEITQQRLLKVTSRYQPQVDKDFLDQYQSLTHSFMNYGKQLVAPQEPLATICHGDYLRNNIAYKYDKDTPVDVMMFDYQTMRLCSPMIDLTLFLSLSTLTDVRCRHFEKLFDDYCAALFSSYIENTQLPLPDFLNRENLLKEYIRFLPHSLGIASFFLAILVDPLALPQSDMFTAEINEELIQAISNVGGELVDHELAHQMRELFELSKAHNVQIDKNIDITEWVHNLEL
ncbi:uncharacterized protein LOC108597264 [Drosophila busckii]|uniref:uncharacterized protein LOC108597264 n=1 Tax=Drosophila busckii TaxID=30019 RepID=UPI00083EACF5|nr:uncharacterized protein LOC108597264 [Drosophila busckii]